MENFNPLASQRLGQIHYGARASSFRSVCPTSVVGKLPPNRVLFWQGEQRSRDIEIVDGVARAVHILLSGERNILGFFWPGDVILSASRHLQSYTAETVTACVVRSSRSIAYGPESLDGTWENDPVLQQALLLLQTIKQRNALERVAWFLLRMRAHLPHLPQMPDAIKFVIPRNDIANHIGTSLETVCRSLAELKERGVIEMPDRKTIRFSDARELTRIANGLEPPRS